MLYVCSTCTKVQRTLCNQEESSDKIAAQRAADQHLQRAQEAEVALGASRAAEQRLQQHLDAAEKASRCAPYIVWRGWYPRRRMTCQTRPQEVAGLRSQLAQAQEAVQEAQRGAMASTQDAAAAQVLYI